MRLICPNCDAQYEVPDDVIPSDGRDVQCSNCGNTWFFKPVDPRDLEADDVEAEARAAVTPSGDGPDTTHEVADEETAEAVADAPETPQKRRRLDPEIANVLREEAEYEARARQAERNTLETQPELGLPPGDSADAAARQRAEEARQRMARLAGEDVPGPDGTPRGAEIAADPASSAAAIAAESSRRGLLPDVEHINATLAAEEDRPLSDEDDFSYRASATPRKSRRWGMLLSITFLALGTAAYVFAPQISEAVPEFAEPMADYVSAVNAGRAWLDAQVLKGLAWVNELQGGGAVPAPGDASE